MLINTFRGPWHKGRLDGWVTANDTAFTDATRSWKDRSRTKMVELPIGGNAIVLAFIGGSTDAGDPDGDTFTAKIYEYADVNSWAEMVYDVDCTVGAMEAWQLGDGTAITTANGGKFVDTMASGYTSNSTQWLTEVGFADYGGNDGLAVMAWDGLGGRYMYIEITALTANLKVYPIFKIY